MVAAQQKLIGTCGKTQVELKRIENAFNNKIEPKCEYSRKRNTTAAAPPKLSRS